MSVNKLQRYTTKGVHPQYSPRPDPDGYWVEYDKVAPLEARVRELEAEVEEADDVRDMVRRGWADCEQKLADANALLREMNYRATVPYTDEGNDLKRRVEAHLAGQPAAPAHSMAGTELNHYDEPAAPSRTEVCPTCQLFNCKHGDPARTEAEQAVLAAADTWYDGWVEEYGPAYVMAPHPEQDAALWSAVRARRGLK